MPTWGERVRRWVGGKNADAAREADAADCFPSVYDGWLRTYRREGTTFIEGAVLPVYLGSAAHRSRHSTDLTVYADGLVCVSGAGIFHGIAEFARYLAETPARSSRRPKRASE